MGRRDAPGDAAPPPFAADEVAEHEREDAVRRDVPAALVADAEPVGVAVAREAETRPAGEDLFGEPDQLLLAALRRQSAEERIALRIQARETRPR